MTFVRVPQQKVHLFGTGHARNELAMSPLENRLSDLCRALCGVSRQGATARARVGGGVENPAQNAPSVFLSVRSVSTWLDARHVFCAVRPQRGEYT